jgi:FkbM family methyltransferase
MELKKIQLLNMSKKKLLKKFLPYFIKSFVINTIWNLKDKNYCFIYNLISRLLFHNKNYLTHDNKRFILKEKNFKWSFSYKTRGLYYLNGILERGKQLHRFYLIEDIKFNKDDIVIDIGANIGDFYLGFEQKIKYYAYEPSPIVFSSLEYNLKNQNFYNLGLSNTEGNKIDFFLKDESGDSSILPIKNYTKKITIGTTTLDKEIAKIQQKIKLIKLEAEGFEPEILQGLKKYLNYVEYIAIDCGFERGLNQESTIAECSNYLIKNNFKMINFNARPRIVTLFKKIN